MLLAECNLLKCKAFSKDFVNEAKVKGLMSFSDFAVIWLTLLSF